MQIISLIDQVQRQFHDTIARDISALHDGGSVTAFVSLALAGFLYGVFHAAGPGHGKMVISGYLLADHTTIRKGLLITALSSLLQAVVAITLVLSLFYGMGLARAQTEYVAAWFECVSFGLIALIGFVLMVKGIKGPAHNHEADCDCGHHHGPAPVDLLGVDDWKTVAGMIVSIGIRPCSGALILMFFACLMGEVYAGMAATLAMAIGTALTVSTIAMAVAGSKAGVIKLVHGSEQFIGLAGQIVRIAGGALILFLGAIFCYHAIPRIENSDVISPYYHPLRSHPR